MRFYKTKTTLIDKKKTTFLRLKKSFVSATFVGTPHDINFDLINGVHFL